MAQQTNVPLTSLPAKVREFVEEYVPLMQPKEVHVCDGSDQENQTLLQMMVDKGVLVKLTKFENRYVGCMCIENDPWFIVLPSNPPPS